MLISQTLRTRVLIWVSTEAHNYLQSELQTLLNDSNFTLPPFKDINRTMINTKVSLFVDGIKSDPAQALYDFSNLSYVNQYVYGNSFEMYEYIPNWIANKDWLKVPATYTDYKVDFEGTTVSFYLVSKIGDIEEIKTTIGIEDVELLTERIITTEDTLYVYRVSSYDFGDINFTEVSDSITSIFY